MANIIHETTDYEKFELHDFNRDVRRTDELERSMRTHGWLSPYPMHVTPNGRGKFKIKAGHHRFDVARRLKIPVKYVISEDSITIHDLEKATNAWTLQDYGMSYARMGIDAYIELWNFHQETGIPLRCCMSMLAGESAGSQNQRESFKTGEYRIKAWDHAREVAQIIEVCLDAGLRFSTQTNFVVAISLVCKVEKFDTRQFMKKVKRHPGLLKKQVSKDAYLMEIESVYNYGARGQKIPLAFLAKEAAIDRLPRPLGQYKRQQ